MLMKFKMNHCVFLGSLAWIFSAGPSVAGPMYTFNTYIPVPAAANNSTGGFSFDISFFDGTTQRDYVADRSNFGIDVFSAVTNSFLTRIEGTGLNAFVGTVPSPDTGPNGVLVVNIPGQHYLYGGDGNSTVKGFDLANGNAPLPGSPIATAASPLQGRADEMAFDPGDKILIVANDHGSPSPFVSLISTTSNTVLKTITFDGSNGTPNATSGIEQPVWNPNTGKFYISIPKIGTGSDPGGIAVVDPISQTVVKVYDLATFGILACNPTGLALGTGNQLMVGCSSTQSILFDPTANGGNGAIINVFPQANGVDELAFDSTNGLFFLAGSNNTNGPTLSIIDGLAASFIQNIATSTGAHSVSVDPVSNEVFVPLRATASIAACVTGCIEVFSVAAVPEPATLPIMLAGLVAFLVLAWWPTMHWRAICAANRLGAGRAMAQRTVLGRNANVS